MATLSVLACAPSPAEDADQLHHAFEGWGTNENLIISILAHRNAAQRKLIRQAYKEKYGEDLLKSLDKELSQDFERAVLLWTLHPAERDARLANEAVLKKPPTNHIFIEIACTRDAMELFLVRKAYQNQCKRSLEEDIAAHTKGNFRKLFVPLVSAHRYEGLEVNMTLAKAEAKKLHDDIKEKACDHEEIIRILTTRSKAQLRATLNHYNDQYGCTFEQDLEAEPEDEFLSTLKVVICCLTCPEIYFEKVLRLAINRLGTDEEALTRIVTTRAEVDMEKIKEQYYKRNSVTLDQAIIGDTSGDYKAILLSLIGHGDA